MSGIRARQGFRYQDAVLMERLLQDVIALRRAAINGTASPTSRTFALESAVAGTGPDWDILEIATAAWVLEEVKSGQISPDDRRDLWMRVRRSLGRAVGEVVPIVRLVVDRDNPPSLHSKWPDLATAVSSAQIPTAPPRPVTSANGLAQEALFYLVRGDDDGKSAPLREDIAKALIARFVYDASTSRASLEEQIELLLRQLTSGLGVHELADAVLGYIAAVASTSDTQRRVSAEEVIRRISLLDTLTKVSADDARLWQQIARRAMLNATVTEQRHGLRYQNWRTVQPHVAELVDGRPARLAIVGSGGTGKSMVVQRIAEERRALGDVMYLVGADLREVAPSRLMTVFGLAAFLAAAAGREFVIVIDAFENAATTPGYLRDVLSALGCVADSPAVSVIIGMRATRWHELRGAEEAVPGWISGRLDSWDPHLVASLVGQSQRPTVTGDLLRLLCTPLFLDLFLLTFGVTDPVPDGIRTRHHVLTAYWRRRILQPDDASAPARRVALMRCAEEEASGAAWHDGAESALGELASEGILVIKDGRYRFRHDLLRDFTMMAWVVAVPSTNELCSRLARVRDSLVRFGALRAVFDASCDVSDGRWDTLPSAADLLAATANERDLPLVEVLGELDDVDVLGAETLEIVRSSTVGIIQVARVTLNSGWLVQLSRLPDGSHWAEEQTWLDVDALREFGHYLEALWKVFSEKSRPDLRQVFQAVARRLRAWSRGVIARAGEESWRLASILDIVAELDPTPSTVQWMRDLPMTILNMRYAVLSALRVLADKASNVAEVTDPQVMEAAFLNAAGLAWRDNAVLTDSGRPLDGHLVFQTVDMALLGRHGPAREMQGLVDSFPIPFLRIALGIVTGCARHRDEQQRARSARLAADPQFQALMNDRRSTEPIRDLEDQLSSRGDRLAESEALRGLIDDLEGSEDYSNRWDDAAEAIVVHVRSRIQTAVAAADDVVLQRYWEILRGTSSATARVLMLDVLSGAEQHYASIVDDIIADDRLVHCPSAGRYLVRAIRSRWGNLDRPKKDRIAGILRAVSRSPILSIYEIAPLLTALPESERSETDAPYFDLFRLRGWNPDPTVKQERPARQFECEDEPQPSVEDQILDGLSEVTDEEKQRWRKIGGSTKEMILNGDDAQRGEAHDDVVFLLKHLRRFEGVNAKLWLLQRVTALMEGLIGPRPGEQPSLLTGVEAMQVSSWALETAGAITILELAAKDEHLYRLWEQCIMLLDTSVSHPDIVHDVDLNHALFAEIERAVTLPAEHCARVAFCDLRPYHWWRADSCGKSSFRTLFGGVIGDGDVLRAGLDVLSAFSGDEQRALLVSRLATAEPSVTRAADKFAKGVGGYLGCAILVRHEGERLWVRDLIDEWLIRRPIAGVLAIDDNYREWLEGVGFGAKDAADRPDLPPTAVQDFCEVMAAIWKRRSTLPRGERPAALGHFAMWAFYPAVEERIGELTISHATWWKALHQLAVEVIRDGDPRDLSELLFSLRDKAVIEKLDMTTFEPLISALAARVDRTDPAVLIGTANNIDSWSFALEYACDLFGNIASLVTDDQRLISKIHDVLQNWSRLGIGRAVEVAQYVRGLARTNIE